VAWPSAEMPLSALYRWGGPAGVPDAQVVLACMPASCVGAHVAGFGGCWARFAGAGRRWCCGGWEVAWFVGAHRVCGCWLVLQGSHGAVAAAQQQLAQQGHGSPTHFEVVTALALKHFADQQVRAPRGEKRGGESFWRLPGRLVAATGQLQGIWVAAVPGCACRVSPAQRGDAPRYGVACRAPSRRAGIAAL